MRIGILGGGITGLTIAAHLTRDYEVLEGEARCGGHCRSLTEAGFTFDLGGAHIIFSRNRTILDYELSLLGDNAVQGRRNNKIFLDGRYVKYPFENGLYDLAPEDRFECLYAYLRNEQPPPTNFREWMYYTFGKGITEKYLLPYNEKVWNTPAHEMSLHWVEGRVPKPPLEDVIKAAVGVPTEGYTHQLNFYYPKRGGFQALCDAMQARARNVVTGARVERIEHRRDGSWLVTGTFGERRYDVLVATIPIHALVQALGTVPRAVAEATAGLRYNSLITVNLGLDTAAVADYLAVYFPEPRFRFNRVSFMAAFSPYNVPPGKAAVQAEITARVGDDTWALSDAALVAHVADSLDAIGAIRKETISFRRVARATYAYVVYDLRYHENIKTVKDYMAELGLILCGRFAEWEYINSDVCVERGIKLAEVLNAR